MEMKMRLSILPVVLLIGMQVTAVASTPSVPGTALVAAGGFRMGSPSAGRDDERPARRVTVDGFRMMTTEVTFEAYDAFARATGRRLPYDQGWGRGDRPVVNVGWYDAVAYANWLSEQHKLTSAYRIDGTTVEWDPRADGWRLPTEAEWEFAAAGGAQGTDSAYAGSDGADTVAWYALNSDRRTQPVAGKAPNELGLYDMSGNVWEWCWDLYGEYPDKSETNPTGPAAGPGRVIRGGSWDSMTNLLRIRRRGSYDPSGSAALLGFRLVASAVP